MSGKITAQPGSTLARLLAKKNETKDDVRHPHKSDDKETLSDKMLMITSKETPLTTLTGGYYGDDFVIECMQGCVHPWELWIKMLINSD